MLLHCDPVFLGLVSALERLSDVGFQMPFGAQATSQPPVSRLNLKSTLTPKGVLKLAKRKGESFYQLPM